MDRRQNIAGTVKGNEFSGDLRRGTSCLTIKSAESKKLGTTIASPCKNTEEQVVSTSCVDGTCLMTDGEDGIEKRKKASMSMAIDMVLLIKKLMNQRALRGSRSGSKEVKC